MSWLLVAVALAAASASAEVYKVGDSTGWTTLGNFNYKQWAAAKNFRLGDIIVFEYNAQFHNVMQVTHAEYRACNTTSPKATYTTGNDSITLTRRGHHYYFCGVPGHCQSGQKVDINVPRLAVRAPSPSELASPMVPATPANPPSTNAGVAASPTTGVLLATMVLFLGDLLFSHRS
ncbi:hypothetical protein MLD38_039628 [Melastoma candidum]|uniref:Uncharacterized protein n=1 Tax=Melastoma candidum TaxID=119954 RepID=A0ACB9L3F8_9MYRT|nr:hypothetical protein MLD38_039628 [Melastoma candidum]